MDKVLALTRRSAKSGRIVQVQLLDKGEDDSLANSVIIYALTKHRPSVVRVARVKGGKRAKAHMRMRGRGRKMQAMYTYDAAIRDTWRGMACNTFMLSEHSAAMLRELLVELSPNI